MQDMYFIQMYKLLQTLVELLALIQILRHYYTAASNLKIHPQKMNAKC